MQKDVIGFSGFLFLTEQVMNIKEVHYPEFIPPQLLQSLPYKSVVENGTVNVCGSTCAFDGEPFPDGEEVILFYGNYKMECRTVEDHERFLEKQENLKNQMYQAKLQKQKDIRHNNLKFNQSLNIPVKWSPDIKHVLSGMSRKSDGSGTFKNSVVHVVLLEPLESGRLKRGKWDYLCSQPTSKGYTVADFWHGRDLDEYKVNCKSCLKIAERWK